MKPEYFFLCRYSLSYNRKCLEISIQRFVKYGCSVGKRKSKIKKKFPHRLFGVCPIYQCVTIQVPSLWSNERIVATNVQVKTTNQTETVRIWRFTFIDRVTWPSEQVYTHDNDQNLLPGKWGVRVCLFPTSKPEISAPKITTLFKFPLIWDTPPTLPV
jgi:hypothetical protein